MTAYGDVDLSEFDRDDEAEAEAERLNATMMAPATADSRPTPAYANATALNATTQDAGDAADDLDSAGYLQPNIYEDPEEVVIFSRGEVILPLPPIKASRF